MDLSSLDDYTVAWICALPLEAAAARVMLDKTHPLPPVPDPYAYELGELHGHHIVIAYLPNGVYGTVSAAAVISRMRLTFPRLQYGLMVGIGGGVPSPHNDIRLGDIVVSKPGANHGGVIQYDFGKAVQGHLVQTGTLNQPPHTLLTHLSQVEASQIASGTNAISELVSDALERHPSLAEKFTPPEEHTDRLFHSYYHHADMKADCEGKCDDKYLVERKPRGKNAPYIHHGLIASGNQVMKDSEARDRLAKEHGILCFEMEAAGLMNELPTLVIRGIADYCDSHKQKEWQGYAALTAAAFTKLLLAVMPVQGAMSAQSRHG